jgi:adenylate cyclase
MGDAIMAFWNAPLDDADHAGNACRSAVAMVVRVEALNETWRAEDEAAGRTFVPVAIGIGINSGEALVGNLGSDQRFDYSCLGDEVNVASRLEGLSKYYGMSVVVGEATALRQKALAVMELDLIRVKGRARPSRIYTLVDALRAGREQTDRLMPLHQSMLAALRSKEFDNAEALIGECRALGIASLESYYRTCLARIGQYREEPPPEDWDGAYTAETK